MDFYLVSSSGPFSHGQISWLLSTNYMGGGGGEGLSHPVMSVK